MHKLLLPLLMLAVYVAGSVVRDPAFSASSYPPPPSLEKSSIVNDEFVRNDRFPVLTRSEFDLFSSSIAEVKNENCAQDFNSTLLGILNGYRWAIAMYDATVKSAVGIESGMRHQFGHYDECLSQKKYQNEYENFSLDDSSTKTSVRAQYCLINVTLDGLSTHGIASRKKHLTNQTIAYWGACIPASCSTNDVAIFMWNFLQRPVAVDSANCDIYMKQLHVTNDMFNYALVICFFVFLAVMSTAYHAYLLYTRDEETTKPNAILNNEILNMALISFSIIENTKKLFQASKDQLGLNSINGIKAIAMILILAGHALSFIYGGPVYNAEFIDEQIKLPFFGFLTNSLLFVDTFLLLSGFLFCRILLIALERRRGKINVLVLYAARYIRLTPAYMAVIGFYMTWFPHAGDGPIWRQRIEREQERCSASWWLNILYINNYIQTDKLCMFQSWYLSVDSQLFFVAPLVIFFLYKSRKHGLRFLVALVALAAMIPFLATYVNKFDPTLLVYADEINDLGSNTFYIDSYIKTHMRASAYVVGLLTGYLVHVMQERGTKLSSFVVRLTWLTSSAVGVTSMFSICHFYAHPFNNLESTLYAGFHKLCWNVSVAWLVVAATTGHAGWLQRVLSSRLFAPISRLTYCAYLCNGLVELYHSSRIRTHSFLGYTNLINDVLSHILDTFALAFVVCLLFESPIHALERILLRNVGHGQQQERKRAKEGAEHDTSSHTPSTSEEQMA